MIRVINNYIDLGSNPKTEMKFEVTNNTDGSADIVIENCVIISKEKALELGMDI